MNIHTYILHTWFYMGGWEDSTSNKHPVKSSNSVHICRYFSYIFHCWCFFSFFVTYRKLV